MSFGLILTSSIKKAAPLKEEAPIFAVKFIHKDYAQRHGRIKPRQIQMEVTLHKHIGVHSNIIEFYDAGEDGNWTWIAMELAEGGDLFDKIEADAGVSEDIAHVYFTQLVNAVSYMHSKGIGHRDIKPENVLLSADGDLKIADFGMATLFEHQGKRKLATTLCGSPPYVAPEVLSCASQGSKKGPGYAADSADIWSCGVVLFVLLAGNTPWGQPIEDQDEEYRDYISTKGRPADELWDGLPVEVLSLLRGMIRIDTGTRFSWEEVRRHPWFTRRNDFMDEQGQLTNPLSLATSMFQSLKIDFSSSRAPADAMEIDTPDTRPLASISASQPIAPANDMLIDWEAMDRLHISPRIAGRASTQSVLAADYLAEEPSLSQFTMTPSVPISRTQMARRFRDILPAQTLTRFFSVWEIKLLVQTILTALHRLGIPEPKNFRPPRPLDRECQIKINTKDERMCPLTGLIDIAMIQEGAIEITFVKNSGDPLEWRRFFKRVTVGCRDAVYKPEE